MNEQHNEFNSVAGSEVATLAGGCFWCLEAVFLQLKGVLNVLSGYSGGSVESPTYREVCAGVTGHAEIVQVSFDPETISFREILDVFFTIHDPTTLNRQGNDTGTQYRSAIFYHTDEQKKIAEEEIAKLSADHVWDAPIVTEVVPFEHFYPAGDYHKDYFRRNSEEPYCRIVIEPKVAKLRKLFVDRLKKE